MLKQILVLALMSSVLGACGEKEPEVACCAIEPKAKCDAALHGLGITPEESRAMFAADACPTAAMSMDRIRELDAQWPQDCREAGMTSPLQQVNTRACPDTSPASLTPPNGVDPLKWSACNAGLKARKLTDNEMWVMLHSDQICPNAGVTEARIREIVDKDWEAASCTYATKEQVLGALTSGACGGDAG